LIFILFYTPFFFFPSARCLIADLMLIIYRDAPFDACAGAMAMPRRCDD